MENKPAKKHMGINFLLPLFTILLALLALAVMMVAVVRIYHSFERLADNEAQRRTCEDAILQLMDASDYLTEQVYNYCETCDKKYMEAYWREINLDRNREKAVSTIMRSSLSNYEKSRAVAAKANSDALSVEETRAMRLISDSLHLPKSEMPDQVAEFKLSEADAALSSAEKYDAAADYLHGAEYREAKTRIESSVESFRADVDTSLGDETIASSRSAWNILHMESLCFVAAVLLLIFTVILYRVRITKKEKQLHAALSEATRANEVKSVFLSQVSHDMRTPMNAIIGFSEDAEHIERDEARENLRRINISGHHLLTLINDLLDTSKLEAGKLELDLTPATFEDTMLILESTVMPEAEKKGIEFTVKTDGLDSRPIMVDTLRLNQILLNLLNNSVKYTPAGGRVELEVNMISQTEKSQTHRFIIRDNGCGMTPDFQEKMFLPFCRDNNDVPGSGLGLTIVKQLVELMGGEIAVKSVSGEGTEFAVTLTSTIATPEQIAARAKLHENFSARLSGKRILLVEDHNINAELAKKLLTAKGMSVERVENGALAVEKMAAGASGDFDCILMDVRMPVMDGLEATRRIRALDRADAETIPIIALSANAFEENISECMEAGMNAHLSKPIEPDELFFTIDALTVKTSDI